MTTPLMSIIALYNWDNTLFDFFNVPEPLDKEMLENNLLMELGELSVIYSEPVFLKWAIGQWSNKQAPIWKKLYDTTLYDYNPIHNRDYTEWYDDTRNVTRQQNGTENREFKTTDNSTENYSNTSDTTRDLTGNGETNTQGSHSDTGTDESTNTRSVSAYNMENSYAPAEQSVENKSHTYTTAINDTETRQNSENETTNIKDDSETTSDRTGTETGDITTGNSEKSEDIFTHRYHGEGNVGITTTQSMINEEREVVKFNIYDYIIEEFKQRFCVMVY